MQVLQLMSSRDFAVKGEWLGQDPQSIDFGCFLNDLSVGTVYVLLVEGKSKKQTVKA